MPSIVFGGVDSFKRSEVGSGPGQTSRARLIAATAELAGLTVLHLDGDFDLIAELTGQPTERLRM